MIKRSALLGALVVLLVPAAAHGALGGANALTTSLRPDLRSATVQSTNAVDDTTTVRVCFSKAIASLPQAGLFHMGSYATNVGTIYTATSATRSTSNCADVVFPNDDATQFTFVTVDGSDGSAPDSGVSAVSTNGFGNIRDSTALIGSKTNNGTRGFTNAPDLVGITVNNAAATIDYTYDQRVAAVSPLATAFSYNRADGTPVDSIAGADQRAISADGLTVRVNFPPGPAIQGAVRAHSATGAVSAKAANAFDSPLRSFARPGSGGFTDRPDLVAVTLGADNSFVDFQFDQVITALGALGDFRIVNADGSAGSGASHAVLGGLGVGNTVRVQCPDCAGRRAEFVVTGIANAAAVTGVGGTSTAGGLPAGGNAGAFATGFTVTTEALQVAFDDATDVASVLFDQRWIAADETQFKLLDDQGSQISVGAISVSGTGATTTGKTTAQITFPAGTLAGARSLLIQPGATRVAANIAAFNNRVQVISPTAPAARTARKFRKAKTITAKQRAAMRRAAKRAR